MTYEYRCRACHHEWEAQQRMSDPELVDCPRCGLPQAERLCSGGSATVFEGGCWSRDGYASRARGVVKDQLAKLPPPR